MVDESRWACNSIRENRTVPCIPNKLVQTSTISGSREIATSIANGSPPCLLLLLYISAPLYIHVFHHDPVKPAAFSFFPAFTQTRYGGARANFLCPRAFSTISVVLLKFRARSGFRGWKHNDPRLKSIVLGGHFSGFLRKIARNAIRRRFDSHKRTNERTQKNNATLKSAVFQYLPEAEKEIK